MKKSNTEKYRRISKRLSYVLRHNPTAVGITLDDEGWAVVDELLLALKKHGASVDLPILKEVVANNDKKRFSFSDDELRIRANQGHSIAVDLGLTPQEPPHELFHGTATRFLESIQEQGLMKQNRQHVHLSFDTKTAQKVGSRHGKVVVLIVQAKAMHDDGFPFFLSQNGVWLTDHVPVKYIEFPD